MNEWMNDENYKAFEVIENLFEFVLSHLTDSTIQESYSIFLTGLSVLASNLLEIWKLAEEREQLYYMQDSAAELRAAFALRLGQLQGEQTKQDPLMGSSELQCTWSNWWSDKVFGPGTLLRITDKSPDEDIYPKPTIFLPSVAEIKIHKAGTYLCLLEDFFPDIIKIDWQEKDGKTILKSQQGDTMKTKDTYMKFSWLTVTEASMDKEHKCIVNHESDKTKVNQEILFPSINKDLVAAMESEVDSQGPSETKQNTEVVTVSPLSSQSFSPVPGAVVFSVDKGYCQQRNRKVEKATEIGGHESSI
nr:uncharacterized protein LOC110574299 [Neomonachus schauinslandi]